MKILGISSDNNSISASIVEDGKIVLASKTFSGETLGSLTNCLDETLIEAGIDIKALHSIVIDQNLSQPLKEYISQLTGKKDIPLENFDGDEALISSLWLVSKENKEEIIPFPFLCLVLTDTLTELRLISAKNNQKILHASKGISALHFFNKMETILECDKTIEDMCKTGDEARFQFSQFLSESLFSFSSLKKAVEDEIEKQKKEHEQYKDKKDLHDELTLNWKSDIAASAQEAIINFLVSATIDTAYEIGTDTIALVGEMSKNARLRDKFGRECHEHKLTLHYPIQEFAPSAMLAAEGYWKFKS
jgi:predicted NodU family carbamoyl transferase